jgi:signal transduction histidine kinase
LTAVRNPINNASLAAELAAEALAKSVVQFEHSNSTTGSNSSQSAGPQLPYVSELVDNIIKSTDTAMHVLNDALNLQRLQAGSFEFVPKLFGLFEAHNQVVQVMQPQMEHKNISVSSLDWLVDWLIDWFWFGCIFIYHFCCVYLARHHGYYCSDYLNFIVPADHSINGSINQSQLVLDVDESLTDIHVVGDVHRIKQVILNFLTNAYKFTPEGGRVCVNVKEIGRSDGKVTVHTSITDSGIGMSEENITRLFKPWAQVSINVN